MRKINFLTSLFVLLLCFSCEKLQIDEKIIIVEHSYDEIKEQIIYWNNIFTIDLNHYFVYVYSPSCAHCDEIKNEIIEFYFSKSEEMFFVEYNSSIPIGYEKENIIYVKDINKLYILGTPSLLEIKEKQISDYIAGSTKIREFLTLYKENKN